jgi:hypothetical protein
MQMLRAPAAREMRNKQQGMLLLDSSVWPSLNMLTPNKTLPTPTAPEETWTLSVKQLSVNVGSATKRLNTFYRPAHLIMTRRQHSWTEHSTRPNIGHSGRPVEYGQFCRTSWFKILKYLGIPNYYFKGKMH